MIGFLCGGWRDGDDGDGRVVMVRECGCDVWCVGEQFVVVIGGRMEVRPIVL